VGSSTGGLCFWLPDDTLTFHDPIPVLIIALHGHTATAVGDHRAHLFHGHNILQKGYTGNTNMNAMNETAINHTVYTRHMFALCLSAGVMWPWEKPNNREICGET